MAEEQKESSKTPVSIKFQVFGRLDGITEKNQDEDKLDLPKPVLEFRQTESGSEDEDRSDAESLEEVQVEVTDSENEDLPEGQTQKPEEILDFIRKMMKKLQECDPEESLADALLRMQPEVPLDEMLRSAGELGMEGMFKSATLTLGNPKTWKAQAFGQFIESMISNIETTIIPNVKKPGFTVHSRLIEELSENSKSEAGAIESNNNNSEPEEDWTRGYLKARDEEKEIEEQLLKIAMEESMKEAEKIKFDALQAEIIKNYNEYKLKSEETEESESFLRFKDIGASKKPDLDDFSESYYPSDFESPSEEDEEISDDQDEEAS